MSKLLTIQEKDRERIEHLMQDLHIKKQIDVVRAGLDLLEEESARIRRIKRWEKAVKAINKTSKNINKDFQKYSGLKNL